jgi:autoinducer 2-degrading protein
VIVLVAKYRVRPGHTDDVLKALTRMKPLVEEAEPGCRLYQVSRSVDEPDLLMLHEHYVDDAALAAHRETPHFQAIIEGEVVPVLESRERELFQLEIG